MEFLRLAEMSLLLELRNKGKMVKLGYLAVQFSIKTEEGSKTEHELGYMLKCQVSQKQRIILIHCASGELAVGFVTGCQVVVTALSAEIYT